MQNKKVLPSVVIFFFFSSVLAVFLYFFPPLFLNRWIFAWITFSPLAFPAYFIVILGILGAVLLGNILNVNKSFFQIIGIVTLIYCGFLLVAGGFAPLGIPFAVTSLVFWIIFGLCLNYLEKIISKMTVYVLVALFIVFVSITAYSTLHVFVDFNHVKKTALNYQLLNEEIAKIESISGGYDEKKQQLYSLDLCGGFHRDIYEVACERKQLAGVKESEFRIATRSSGIPGNYCEDYIKTIDGGSIEKYSFRYWSGLNMCYKSTAENIQDCNRIQNNEDLKKTCINEIK